jgi:hypothetical protein
MLVLFCSEEDAESIFRDAATMNMTEGDFVWIVTEQVLVAKNVPAGELIFVTVFDFPGCPVAHRTTRF